MSTPPDFSFTAADQPPPSQSSDQTTEPATNDLVTPATNDFIVPAMDNLTIERVRAWGTDQLLEWIQKTRPKLLNDKVVEIFKAEEIDGETFLNRADDFEFFKKCSLPLGTCDRLTTLAADLSTLVGAQSDRSRKRPTEDPYNPPSKRRNIYDELEDYRQMAKDYRQMAKLALQNTLNTPSAGVPSSSENIPITSGATLRKKREIAKLAREQRHLIQEKNLKLEDLYNPSFDAELPFPFASDWLPSRFKRNKADKADNPTWYYMGREMFKTLWENLQTFQMDRTTHTLWLYRTKGYGKSHLLAALVCYLTAQSKPVVYIPDCEGYRDIPIDYI